MAIICIMQVANLTLTSDAPVAYIDQEAPVKYCFVTSWWPPTMAKVWFDFGDGHVDKLPTYPNFGLCTKHSQANAIKFPHTYAATGL